MVKAIVGANWGDEGKGKITDLLAVDSDVVVRFQGGANAGHTIINEYGKFALHLLPSGVFSKNAVNIIAQGVAFDIDKFFNELVITSYSIHYTKLYDHGSANRGKYRIHNVCSRQGDKGAKDRQPEYSKIQG